MSKYLVITSNWDKNRACRVCLTIDANNLYPLRSHGLARYYTELTDIPVSARDGLPQYICGYCKALLLKAFEFRQKCRSAVDFLKKCSKTKPITNLFLSTLDTTAFQHPYTSIPITIDEVPPSSVNEQTNIPINTCDVENPSILRQYLKGTKSEHDVYSQKNSHNSDNDSHDNENYSINTDYYSQKNSNYSQSNDDNSSDTIDAPEAKINIDDSLQNDHNYFEDLFDEDSDDKIKRECKTGNNDIDNKKDEDSNNDRDSDVCKKETNTMILRSMTNVAAKSAATNVIKKRKVGVDSKKSSRRQPSTTKSSTRRKVKKLVITAEPDNEITLPKLFENVSTDLRHRVIKYVTSRYEQKSIGYRNDVVEVVTDDDLDFVLDDDLSEGKDTKIETPNIGSIKALAKDNSLMQPRQRFYRYVRDIYFSKKQKFEVKRQDLIDYEAMEERHKAKLEAATKKYNFEMCTYSLEEQKQRQIDKTKKFEYCEFKCGECLRGFSTEKIYNHHMKAAHDPSRGALRCAVCGHRSPTARRAYRHALSHRYILQCCDCAEECRLAYQAKAHFMFHRGKEIKCKECGKQFRKMKSYMSHVQAWHSSVSCEICYRKTAQNGLALHRALMHLKTYPCDGCGTVFNTQSALDTHRGDIDDSSPCSSFVPCALCGENFASEMERQDHVAVSHPRVNLRYPRIQKKPYIPRVSCCRCKASGRGAAAPGEDNGGAGAEVECDCSCHVRVASKTMKKTYMCEWCGLVSTNSVTLKSHHLIHTGEKPYECDYCGKRFRLKISLQYHIAAHTGTRNYQCGVCGKAFSNPMGQRRHLMTVHLKRRDYPCHICGKQYSTKDQMQMHINTKHFNMPWPKRIRNRKAVSAMKPELTEVEENNCQSYAGLPELAVKGAKRKGLTNTEEGRRQRTTRSEVAAKRTKCTDDEKELCQKRKRTKLDVEGEELCETPAELLELIAKKAEIGDIEETCLWDDDEPYYVVEIGYDD